MSEFSKDDYGNYYRNGQQLSKDCFGNLSQTGFTVGRVTWFGVEENSLASTPTSSTASTSPGALTGSGAARGYGAGDSGNPFSLLALPLLIEIVIIGVIVYLFVSGSAELVRGGLLMHPIIGVVAALMAILLYVYLYSYFLPAAVFGLVTSSYWAILVFNWTNHAVQINPDRLMQLAIVDPSTAWQVLITEGMRGVYGWMIVAFGISLMLRAVLWLCMRKAPSPLYLVLHPVETIRSCLVLAAIAVILGGLLSLNWAAPKAPTPSWQNEWNRQKSVRFDFTVARTRNDWGRIKAVIVGCLDSARSPHAVEHAHVAEQVWRCMNTRLR